MQVDNMYANLTIFNDWHTSGSILAPTDDLLTMDPDHHRHPHGVWLPGVTAGL